MDKPLIKLENDYPIEEVLFDDDGEKILFSDLKGNIKYLNSNLKETQFIIKSNSNRIFFNQDKTEFYSLIENSDKNITEKIIWDIQPILSNSSTNNSIFSENIVSKNSKQSLKLEEDNILYLYENNTKTAMLSLENDNCNKKDYIDFEGAIISKNKKIIVTWYRGNREGAIKIWDTLSKKLLFTLQTSTVGEVFFTKDEQKILSWDFLGNIYLWDINTGKLLQSFSHGSDINGIEFTKDEKYILSWGLDGTIKLWDIISNIPLQIFKGANGSFYDVTKAIFSKDENLILSCNYYKTIQLWSISLNKSLLTLKEKNNKDYSFISKFTFSEDEKQIFYKYEENIKTYKLYRDRKLKKEFYPLEAEVESGCTLTKSGEIRVLSKEEWEEKKRRYEEALRESE